MIYVEYFQSKPLYDPENFFKQIHKEIPYDRSWPLLCVGNYHREDLLAKTFEDLNTGKKRTRPSFCLEGNYESVERIIGSCLETNGHVSTVAAACSSGAYAVFQAYALSEVCGTPVIVASASRMMENGYFRFWFNSLGAIDESTGIPFDRNSKGFAPGEAMAFFIISARPINPVAYIDTFRFYTQTKEITRPGSIEDIKRILFQDLDISNICWWNAHAPGTPQGDRVEYDIFKSVVGENDIPISSLKGKYGHSITGCYMFELAVALDSIQQGVIPHNERLRDPIFDDERIITNTVRAKTKKFLKFNMGFGGKNVVTVAGLM